MISQWTGTEYKNMEKVFLGVLAGQVEPGLIRVVQATLDFIYYAHFESHTIDSLRKLEEAWISFHDNLHYFSDEGVRKSRDDFNIPKLHSMQHYISSIISRGSADGYSTKSPERLHIDFAKLAYRASNKKGYIKQMTKWLTQQEACHRFAAYLHGTVPGYMAELTAVSETKPDDDELEVDVAGQCEILLLGYLIAKEPSYPHTSISSLMSSFGATNSLPCLIKFLQNSPHTYSNVPAPTHSTCFPIFKSFTVRIPPVAQVTQHITNDVIRAKCRVPSAGVMPKIPSQFDTVLAQETECSQVYKHPLDGE